MHRVGTLSAILILIIGFSPLGAFASHQSRTSSSLRAKIRKLDDDIVKNVPLPILFGLTPDNLTRNFGDPRSGGRSHEGLDIMTIKGAPIVSPTDAVVVRVGVGDSSGNHVYTANPGGETFAYMHLDEVADIDEGDELKKGDLIGYVGNTGNASGGAPHLHFEIHKGDAKDPYPRIQSIFPMKDKIKYLEEILENHDDGEEFAEFVVRHYRSDISIAQSLNIELPELITKATLAVPVPTTYAITTAPGDLTRGSRGPAVVELQNFLIKKGIASGATLKADGSFGPATERALAEFQAAVGIVPSKGYYGPKTRAYVALNP